MAKFLLADTYVAGALAYGFTRFSWNTQNATGILHLQLERPIMQQATFHLQLKRPRMQNASSLLQLECQTEASFGSGLIEISCKPSL